MEYKNKKLIIIVMIIGLGMASFLGVNLKFAKETVNENDLIGKKIILIDPGHGGIDGGASSKSGTLEKDINLSISLKLKDSLEKQGYMVVMTRDEDAGLYSLGKTIREKKNEDLKNRCKLKDSTGCNMFISIHLNHFPEGQYYGSQVWYSNYKDSSSLATVVQKNFRVDLDPSNKRHEKPAKNAYKVLRDYDTMPSVLIECGFLSNHKEEERLKSLEYQQKIADSISKSIHEFYNKSSN